MVKTMLDYIDEVKRKLAPANGPETETRVRGIRHWSNYIAKVEKELNTNQDTYSNRFANLDLAHYIKGVNEDFNETRKIKRQKWIDRANSGKAVLNYTGNSIVNVGSYTGKTFNAGANAVKKIYSGLKAFVKDAYVGSKAVYSEVISPAAKEIKKSHDARKKEQTDAADYEHINPNAKFKETPYRTDPKKGKISNFISSYNHYMNETKKGKDQSRRNAKEWQKLEALVNANPNLKSPQYAYKQAAKYQKQKEKYAEWLMVVGNAEYELCKMQVSRNKGLTGEDERAKYNDLVKTANEIAIKYFDLTKDPVAILKFDSTYAPDQTSVPVQQENDTTEIMPYNNSHPDILSAIVNRAKGMGNPTEQVKKNIESTVNKEQTTNPSQISQEEIKEAVKRNYKNMHACPHNPVSKERLEELGKEIEESFSLINKAQDLDQLERLRTYPHRIIDVDEKFPDELMDMFNNAYTAREKDLQYTRLP